MQYKLWRDMGVGGLPDQWQQLHCSTLLERRRINPQYSMRLPLCVERSDQDLHAAFHQRTGPNLSPPSSFPVPGDGMIIQIIALATVQPTANVMAPITITAYGSVLQGTYVFHAQGSDSSVSTYPYQIAGVIYLDGNGNISTPSGGTSAGQQTINTANLNGTLLSTTSQITGGSYFVGADGRGTLILNTTDGSGDAITEIFSLAVISSSEVSIAQIGGTLTNSSGTTTLSQSGAGMMQLQDATAASTLPTAGYAFVASGTDSLGDPIVFGGILDIDGQSSKNNPCTGAGCISGNNSLVDMDLSTNTALITCTAGNAPSGMVSQSTGGIPGNVAFSLGNAANCFESNSVQFTGYIVDATHIQIIETDDNAGSGGFLTAGLAVGQGSSHEYVFYFFGTVCVGRRWHRHEQRTHPFIADCGGRHQCRRIWKRLRDHGHFVSVFVLVRASIWHLAIHGNLPTRECHWPCALYFQSRAQTAL